MVASEIDEPVVDLLHIQAWRLSARTGTPSRGHVVRARSNAPPAASSATSQSPVNLMMVATMRAQSVSNANRTARPAAGSGPDAGAAPSAVSAPPLRPVHCACRARAPHAPRARRGFRPRRTATPGSVPSARLAPWDELRRPPRLASSRSRTSRKSMPEIHSLASVNGPSETTTRPSRSITWVASAGGRGDVQVLHRPRTGGQGD